MTPFNRAKDWIVRRLIRALSPHFQRVSANTAFRWWEPNHADPAVQLALRDLVRPGDIVFDVGANIGGLTVVLSRLVGPRGVVCAFEASPRSLADCQQNIVANGCSNVQLFQAAVVLESGRNIPLYFGHHTGSDSIYPTEGQGGPMAEVRTLALDDFVDFTGLSPRLIKMDIEGAEHEALLGMQRTLSTQRPLLILETQPTQPAALDFLRQQGYSIVDAATYRPIQSPADFHAGCVVANVVCVPPGVSAPPYVPGVPWELVRALTKSDLRTGGDHSVESADFVDLPAGRYRFEVQMAADRADNEMLAEIEVDGVVRFRYRADTQRLASSHSSWPLDIALPGGRVRIFCRFLNRTTDPTFLVKQISIERAVGGPFAAPPFS